MRACWAATLLVLVQWSPASCATYRGISAVHRALALIHRHLHKSPCARLPFAETSGSIASSSSSFPLPETVPNSVCHFKGSLHIFLIFLCGDAAWTDENRFRMFAASGLFHYQRTIPKLLWNIKKIMGSNWGPKTHVLYGFFNDLAA